MTEIHTCVVSLLSTNCYIITDKDTKKVAVCDPGQYNERLKDALQSLGIEKIEMILLTHGHFDHITGAKGLKNDFGGDIVISTKDEAFFTNPELAVRRSNFSASRFPEKADITVCEGDTLKLGNTEIKVISTPGHTAGSVCYIFDDNILSGDTLFAGTVGRTDFPTGNYSDILYSVGRLASLEGDYNVYPGHGEYTTLDIERATNPYMSI